MLSVTLPLPLLLCLSEKSLALSLGCKTLQIPPSPSLLHAKHRSNAVTQVVSRWVPLRAGEALANAAQPAGTVRMSYPQLSSLLTKPAALSQVQGAAFVFVVVLLLVMRLLFFNSSSLFISCKKPDCL